METMARKNCIGRSIYLPMIKRHIDSRTFMQQARRNFSISKGMGHPLVRLVRIKNELKGLRRKSTGHRRLVLGCWVLGALTIIREQQ